MRDGRLEGKVALVVGGGSGMGRAGAAAMAAEGAAVVVSDIALDRAEAVAASITDAAGIAVGMHVDVTSPTLASTSPPRSAWTSLSVLLKIFMSTSARPGLLP